MSRLALVGCSVLYFIAAVGEGVPWQLRGCFFAYGVSNLLLAGVVSA
jgi:hypothetical protein